MSGYKQALLDLSPKLFLSFDGDAFEPSTGRLSPAVVPPKILDESGYEHHADLIVDYPSYPTYRLGFPSLIDLEPSGFGFSAGTPSPNPLSPEYFGKSYLVVPHNSDFSFPKRGSYSLVFNFRKEERETLFRQWRSTPSSPNTATMSRPLIRKGLVLEIDTVDYWNGDGVTLAFKYLKSTDGSTQQTFNYSLSTEQMRQSNHFAVSWDVKVGSSALFTATMTIWHNAIIIHQATYDYFDTFPTTNVSSSWEFLGDATIPGYNYTDRQVVMTTLDQLAIFAKGISHDEVSTLYKKTKNYINMVVSQGAYNLWAFDDDNLPAVNTLKDYGSNTKTGTYYGISEGKVFRRYGGPERAPGNYSALFINGGTAMISPDLYGGAPFNPNNDYTIDGWFKTGQDKPGVILSCSSNEYPYRGYTLTINQADGLAAPGRLQLTLSENEVINSLLYGDAPGVVLSYNDVRWHYFCIRRKDGIVEFWVDGIIQGSINTGNVSIGASPGGLAFMGKDPGDLWTEGQIALVSTHNFALHEANIRARYSYGIAYRIMGKTTLEGIPYSVDIRCYNHRTGALIDQIESSFTDGSYMFRLYDDSQVDITAMKLESPNVRPRTFGPLSPVVFDDDPTTP